MELPIQQDISEAPQKPSHSFLSLPGEIRNRVYEMVLLYPGGRKRGRRRRRFQGSTKLLRLSKQVYEESRFLLHDSPQVVDLSLGDGSSGCGPLFRSRKTKYKRSKGNLVIPWLLFPQPTVNLAVDKFTALEFRTFSNVTLQIEYCGEHVPAFWPDSTYYECQAHALRVLKGSKSLKTLTLSLRAWNSSSGISPANQEHHEANLFHAFCCLVPFIRLGGPDTKLVVENVNDDADRVVSSLNVARSQYVRNLSVDPIIDIRRLFADDRIVKCFDLYLEQMPLSDDQSLPSQSSRSYISFDNGRFLRMGGRALCDTLKMFDCFRCSEKSTEVRKPPLFKCKECFAVFQSEGDLHRHECYSVHHPSAFCHEPQCGPYERFCQPYHDETFHFKTKPNSAFKCGICFSKFSFDEGLQNHIRFWGHFDIREGDVLRDLKSLFGQDLDTPERGYQSHTFASRSRIQTSHAKREQTSTVPQSTFSILRTRMNFQYGFKCSSCRAFFRTESALLSHADREMRGACHGQPSACLTQTILGSSKSDALLCHCVNCGEAFDHQADLLRHIKKVNASRYSEPGQFVSLYNKNLPFTHPTGVQCAACPRSFVSMKQFHIHLRWVPDHYDQAQRARLRFVPFSTVPTLPVESEKWLHCKICPERFETRNLQQRHFEHAKCYTQYQN